jgi:hypothetical protein
MAGKTDTATVSIQSSEQLASSQPAGDLGRDFAILYARSPAAFFLDTLWSQRH